MKKFKIPKVPSSALQVILIHPFSSFPCQVRIFLSLQSFKLLITALRESEKMSDVWVSYFRSTSIEI